MMRRLCVFAFGLLVSTAAQASSTGASRNVQVELVSEVEWVQPGTSFVLGIRQQMAPGWHTYWLNPGDSGLPTRMRWELPEGFQAEPFEWPVPEPISAPPLVSYGYEGEVMLLARVSPPATLKPGTTIRVGGRLDWLECEQACLPGRAQLDLELPVRAESPQADARLAPAFAATRARLPRDGATLAARVQTGAQIVALSFRAPQRAQRATFFPRPSSSSSTRPPSACCARMRAIGSRCSRRPTPRPPNRCRACWCSNTMAARRPGASWRPPRP